ncbi:hypothetical protein AV530_014884 [Patagioenas fasciata monilis]|uniref:Uncharacterized protein n=1 Tax=Patagioenas fasciata monilis TaxID=372326 RepID=A0A1V4K4X1_PATFA|nr:hypothetical protein AV530_014884 [Patagioenas fasciata monilis]
MSTGGRVVKKGSNPGVTFCLAQTPFVVAVAPNPLKTHGAAVKHRYQSRVREQRLPDGVTNHTGGTQQERLVFPGILEVQSQWCGAGEARSVCRQTLTCDCTHTWLHNLSRSAWIT